MLFQRILGPSAGQHKQLGRLEGSSGNGDIPFCRKVTLSLPLPHQARSGAREYLCNGFTVDDDPTRRSQPFACGIDDSNKCLCQPRSESSSSRISATRDVQRAIAANLEEFSRSISFVVMASDGLRLQATSQDNHVMAHVL